MEKIVVKLGGSNLKNKEDIQKIIKVVRRYNRPVIIVVSAFYGITDSLIKAIENTKAESINTNELTGLLKEFNNAIIESYYKDDYARESIERKVTEKIKRLRKLLLGIHCIGDIPKSVEDEILSYGERISALLITSILKYNGIDCEQLLPEDINLITDGEFGNASVDFSLSEKSIQRKLAEDKIYIIPGFYGVSKDKKITLFGRGGTDYSAASIARCVNAESLDIWKDVDGFLSADPKIVENSTQIDRLSYTEAAELAYFGAKILHPRTIEPLMDKRIPIRIFNINNHDNNLTPLSIICNNGTLKKDVIKSVTYNDDFGMLKLRGPGVGIKPGILAKVTTQFDSEGINIKSVITSQIAINFLLAIKDLSKAYDITVDLGLKAINEVIAIDDISVIAVVGEGIIEKHGIAARLFSAVARKRINVEIISLGASHVGAYFIVKKEDCKDAINEIHQEFFENK